MKITINTNLNDIGSNVSTNPKTFETLICLLLLFNFVVFIDMCCVYMDIVTSVLTHCSINTMTGSFT